MFLGPLYIPPVSSADAEKRNAPELKANNTALVSKEKKKCSLCRKVVIYTNTNKLFIMHSSAGIKGLCFCVVVSAV